MEDREASAGAESGGDTRRAVVRVLTIATVILGILVGALVLTARMTSQPSTLPFEYEGYD